MELTTSRIVAPQARRALPKIRCPESGGLGLAHIFNWLPVRQRRVRGGVDKREVSDQFTPMTSRNVAKSKFQLVVLLQFIYQCSTLAELPRRSVIGKKPTYSILVPLEIAKDLLERLQGQKQLHRYLVT